MIFEKLREREALRVHACFLNPYAPFVKIRQREEGNRGCRQDLFDAIESVHRLYQELRAYNEQPGSERLNIKGSLYIKLFSRNPYWSLFRVREDGALATTLIRGGVLVPKHLGLECPELEVTKTGQYQQLFPLLDELAGSITAGKYHILFEWTGGREPEYNPVPKPKPTAYDVFFSYNRLDGEETSKVANAVARKGILPWIDTREGLPPGGFWRPELAEVIRSIRRMAVCFGRHGTGPTHGDEIQTILNFARNHGTQVVILLLPGAIEPTDPFINNYQWIDFRKDWQNGIEEFVRWCDPDD